MSDWAARASGSMLAAEDRLASIRASRRLRQGTQGGLLKAIPAIVAAGDRRAAKAVYGQSKVYLE
ncbi:MAG: hypothetical protein ACE1ZP_03470, partial [Myxococcota bacterium]